nr:hypothetical protein [uncultured Rhodopila sp.]
MPVQRMRDHSACRAALDTSAGEAPHAGGAAINASGELGHWDYALAWNTNEFRKELDQRLAAG